MSAAVIAAALGQFPPTSEQTAVIEAPLAPALVVAGAGSGKTETMAARVVWLVANRHRASRRGARTHLHPQGRRRARRAHPAPPAAPRGVRAPRAARRTARRCTPQGRLDVFGELERAGGDGAKATAARHAAMDALAARGRRDRGGADDDALLHRPTVATYNSFADQIVREHAVRIGRDAEAVVLSESAAWLLMRRVVFASDDPRLETRGEAVRSIVDAALRIARDGVDNLVVVRRARRVPGAVPRRPRAAVDPQGHRGLQRRRRGRGEGRRAGAARRPRPRVRRREAPDRRARLLRPGRRRARGRAQRTPSSPTRCATGSASCSSTSTRTPRSCRPICSPRCSAARP